MVFVVGACVRNKSYKNCHCKFIKPVSQCLISFEVSMLTGEQITDDRLLAKEEARPSLRHPRKVVYQSRIHMQPQNHFI
jgi:hypothetical protein